MGIAGSRDASLANVSLCGITKEQDARFSSKCSQSVQLKPLCEGAQGLSLLTRCNYSYS
jgi:hypothetical protein